MTTHTITTAAGDLPAYERVYRDLRIRILHGELAPGQAVTLRGLAESLGVSVTPAREAVRRLIAERALALTATGRVTAPVLDAAALDALIAARALLEPELAVRALPHATDKLLTKLHNLDVLLEMALKSGQAANYVRTNTAFHATLYEAAGAPALLALVESVWLQINPSMRVLTGRVGTAALVDHHAEAMRALASRDEAALRAAIRADVEQARTLLGQQA